MRPIILLLVFLLLPAPLAAQTGVRQAREAARAASAQEQATSGQAEQAIPPADHSGHGASHDAQQESGAAADHSMHVVPAAPAQAPHVHQEPAPAAQEAQDAKRPKSAACRK